MPRRVQLSRLLVILLLPTLSACAEGVAPKVVTFALTLDDSQESVTVSVPVGTMATYENLPLQFRVGIIPQPPLDWDSGDIDIQVVAVEGKDKEPQVGRLLETVCGKVGYSSVSAAGSPVPLEIKVLEVKQQNLEGRCAVSCGPIFASGGSVISSCGACETSSG